HSRKPCLHGGALGGVRSELKESLILCPGTLRLTQPIIGLAELEMNLRKLLGDVASSFLEHCHRFLIARLFQIELTGVEPTGRARPYLNGLQELIFLDFEILSLPVKQTEVQMKSRKLESGYRCFRYGGDPALDIFDRLLQSSSLVSEEAQQQIGARIFRRQFKSLLDVLFTVAYSAGFIINSTERQMGFRRPGIGIDTIRKDRLTVLPHPVLSDVGGAENQYQHEGNRC